MADNLREDLEGDGIVKLTIDEAIEHEKKWFGGIDILRLAKKVILEKV